MVCLQYEPGPTRFIKYCFRTVLVGWLRSSCQDELRHARDVLGETSGETVGGGKPSRDAGLTPVEERRKGAGLDCSAW